MVKLFKIDRLSLTEFQFLLPRPKRNKDLLVDICSITLVPVRLLNRQEQHCQCRSDRNAAEDHIEHNCRGRRKLYNRIACADIAGADSEDDGQHRYD